MFLKKSLTPHQCFFKTDNAEINKKQEYYNFLHKYCYLYHARYLSDRISVISEVHLFNGTLIEWCSKKQSDTSRRSSNEQTIAMYTGVTDQNWIRNFFRSIDYPIRPPPILYQDNQATIKKFLADRITPQDRTLDFLITALYELHIRKTFEIMDTRSLTCELMTSTPSLTAEKSSEIS